MAQELEREDVNVKDLQPSKNELKDVEPGQQPAEKSKEPSEENKKAKDEGCSCG